MGPEEEDEEAEEAEEEAEGWCYVLTSSRCQRERASGKEDEMAPGNQRKSEIERRKTESFFGVSEWGRVSRTAHLLKQHLG